MKRTILLTAFFATAIALALGILITMPQTLPAPARAALNQYLNYRYDSATQPGAIHAMARATLPTQFTRAMSGASFGASNFFRTSVDYRQSVIVNLPILATPTPGSGEPTYLFASIGNPVPYPPQDVWCVSVSGENLSDPVIFIALHQGLYNADWIAHTPPGDWSAAELSAHLATIGCNLKP